MIAIVGKIPQGVLTLNPKIDEYLGVFTKRSEQVNGSPSYVKVDDNDVMLWCSSAAHWFVGSATSIGRHRGSLSLCPSRSSRTKRIEDAKGTWQAANGPGKAWVDAPDLRLLRYTPPPDEDEVAVVGERTREQRDAEGRKRAIDLDAETPRKRSKVGLETRVAKARSLCQEAVDARVHELLKPAVQEYAKGKIDGAELDTRREAARQQAAAGHAPLTKLDQAFADYNAAVAARVKAEAAEDAAGAKLEAALAELERGQAGPSGVKVESSPVQWVC